MRRADDLPRIIADQSRGLATADEREASGPGSDFYSPVFTATTTNPDVGDTGRVTGWYLRTGSMVTAWVEILMSGAGVSAGSGTFVVSLPVPADTDIHLANTAVAAGAALGAGVARRTGGGAGTTTVVPTLRTASTVVFRTPTENVTDTTPFAWGVDDRLMFQVAYLIR